jgi:hypothetical protein
LILSTTIAFKLSKLKPTAWVVKELSGLAFLEDSN